MNHKMSLKSNKSTKSNNGSSIKLRLRDTLLNMLGEFVALNKSPDVRLNSVSKQFLDEAVREEKRRLSTDSIKARHVRSVSSNAALLPTPAAASMCPLPASSYSIHHSRRTSLPVGPMPLPSAAGRFSIFPPRLRRVAHADARGEIGQRRTSIISESEEEAAMADEDPAVKIGARTTVNCAL